MRLFRQSEPVSWPPVFDRIAAAAAELLNPTARTRPIRVPVSLGELIDRITLLEIQSEHLPEGETLCGIRAELARLKAAGGRVLGSSDRLQLLTSKLRAANEALWQGKEKIRSSQPDGALDPRLVDLARSVRSQRDLRADLLRQIDQLLAKPSHLD
jgi:hypothetical protein